MKYAGIKDYPLELPAFDGPLDLLLHLIRKNRIDIYDIPIHQVAEQYMLYLYRAQRFNLNFGTEFFELAATLLAIKSRMLLPRQTEMEEDPRTELVHQLEEWEAIRQIKQKIMNGFNHQSALLERSPTVLHSNRFKGNLSWQRLHRIWAKVQEKKEISLPRQIVAPEVVSAAELEEDLLKKSAAKNVFLLEYFIGLPTKLHRITAFLVILELVKRQRIVIGENIDGIFIQCKRD